MKSFFINSSKKKTNNIFKNFLNKNGFSFFLTLIIIFVISILAVTLPNDFASVVSKSKNWMSENFTWFFLITPFIFLVILCFFVFSKYGNRRIGDGKPEYSTFTWLAMLFTAGVGVGTLTFGVAESIFHIEFSPLKEDLKGFLGDNVNLETISLVEKSKAAKAVQEAISLSVWDWGIPAMSIYTISGLVIAWFAFNKKYNSTFQPGSAIENGFGKSKIFKYIAIFANVLAGITSVFTVAASVAIAGGNMTQSLSIAFFDGKINPKWVKGLSLLFIGIIAIIYTISSITPLKKGMAKLGNITMYIALSLLVFVFLVGPTKYFINQAISSIGTLPGSVTRHFNTFPLDGAWSGWLKSWPSAYILWWISWTPFMGVFLARISKGRTFRQFCLASVVVPAVFMAIWFSVFGGFSFFNLFNGDQDVYNIVAETYSVNGAFFKLLSKFPLFKILAVISLVVFVTFVATTGISASVSVASIVSKKGEEKPWKISIFIWACAMTLLAVSYVLISGDTGKIMIAIRDFAVFMGAPYLIIIYLQIIAMFKSMWEDKKNNLLNKNIEAEKNNKDFKIKNQLKKHTLSKETKYKLISTIITSFIILLFLIFLLRGLFHGEWGWGFVDSKRITSKEILNNTELSFSIVLIIQLIFSIFIFKFLKIINIKYIKKYQIFIIFFSLFSLNVYVFLKTILELKKIKIIKNKKLINLE